MGSAYDIYPTLKLGDNFISIDLKLLAKIISTQNTVIADGYSGVLFNSFRERLDAELKAMGKNVDWVNIEESFKPETEIDQMISRFMGEEDFIFGKRATIELKDFFDLKKLKKIRQNPGADLTIIYGTDAQLTGLKGLLIYIDLPKNELQFRARAESIKNLGASRAFDMKYMYKRFYFVDWVVLNKHKKEIVKDIDIIVDGQQLDVFTWMGGDKLFLDTFDGGNLSVQCHPRPGYCWEQFGESLTQEETYYIIDRKGSTSVYLGFQEDIDPAEFEVALLESFNTNTAMQGIPLEALSGYGRHITILTPYIIHQIHYYKRPEQDTREHTGSLNFVPESGYVIIFLTKPMKSHLFHLAGDSSFLFR